MQTSVSDGTLYVATRGSWHSRNDPLVRVEVPELEAVNLKGSGDVTITDMSGSALALDGFGSGDFTASGSVDKLTVSGFGSGHFKLSELEARDVSVRLHGSGDANVYASETLDAHTFGSGDVSYKGDPSQVNRSSHGSGDVSPDD